MLDQSFVYQCLKECGIQFFTGVPDSYLNSFCNYLLKYADDHHHVIAANEGNAIGIAAGHYFASKDLPLVYMQNSGLGNAVNPLVSLVDQSVYAVPMVLLIGWRGQPGTMDRPWHRLQGEITCGLLDAMRIPYQVAKDDEKAFRSIVMWAAHKALKDRRAAAIIVPKGVLAGEKAMNRDNVYPMNRIEAMEVVLDSMPADTIYSVTTGRASRELYFLRQRRKESHQYDFLNVGSMGHASSVAFGIALEHKERKVVCLDGDSAAIMHLGAMSMISKYDLPGFIHLVLNNGVHESVGGQPSAGHLIDFTAIAKACGYHTSQNPVESKEELQAEMKRALQMKKAVFLDVRIHKSSDFEAPPLEDSFRDGLKDGRRLL